MPVDMWTPNGQRSVETTPKMEPEIIMKSESSLTVTYIRQFMGMWVQVTLRHWLALTEQDRRLAERLQTVYKELEEQAKYEAEKAAEKAKARAE